MAVGKFNKNVSLKIEDQKTVKAIEKEYETFSAFVDEKIQEYKGAKVKS